ncbi:MAG TPA: hypothetical protein VF476_16060 [Chitinophagaceae bacterium]
MKQVTFIALLFFSVPGSAQELFSATEPASNRAARSISFRVDNSIMDELNSPKTNYHLIPEIMIGVSKKLMISGNIFLSNRSERLRYEGGSIYAKYRFYSNDAMQRHFRMAVFGRLSFNNSDIHQEEINMNGHNTGFETGVVATKLLKKVALSTSVSFVKAADNARGNKFLYGAENDAAINSSFSLGKLMLPGEYKNFRQTNLNLMLEFLSQVNTGSGKYYFDIAPTMQLIFNSQSRIDIGYRKDLKSSLLRTAPKGFFIRIEHSLFNAF